MSSNNDSHSDNEKEEAEVDWDSILYQQGKDARQPALEVKDYVALIIASLETIFLPLVILAIILVILSIWFSSVMM